MARTYCSLIITSDDDAHLADTVERVLGLTGGESVDTQTPEMVARRTRIAQIMSTAVPSSPRYFWTLSSKDVVQGVDLESHVAWLLTRLTPGRTIGEIHKLGCKAKLAFFWASSGRGGGPVISEELLRTLSHHEIPLEFDFYAEEGDAKDGVLH